ncbi:DUF2975 domain-containing protein [Draconibacterium halophilum]|uniref:DUF2975 domain-containing protein n=1 Tax=Draconibacterium halophilum TaxID=2706887 RepID=A0A6C0RCR9_9BACT|nr:DUF2975 domain-containing protein [Draconibacterium halophilum]QIA08140.1 DUF2975 domain-containing protein [Draconibacterium halophilum]
MKNKELTRTQQVLAVMKFLVYLSITWYFLKMGGIVFMSLAFLAQGKPLTDLFFMQDWFNLLETNPEYYTLIIVLVISRSLLNISIWIMVLRLLKRIQLSNPFTKEVIERLERISYLLFSIWILSISAGGFFAWLGEKAGELNDSWDHGPYLFMAGLVFIISQIFKRGVELQSENDLTV